MSNNQLRAVLCGLALICLTIVTVYSASIEAREREVKAREESRRLQAEERLREIEASIELQQVRPRRLWERDAAPVTSGR